MGERKVPLRVDWLSENNLLEQAGAIVGYVVIKNSADHRGIDVLAKSGELSPFKVRWGDSFLFDLSELAQLGFAIGSVKVMEQAIADKEMGEAYDINHQLAEEGEAADKAESTLDEDRGEATADMCWWMKK
jgi:hypothetical protein